jgi:hypothetical protein
MFSISPLHAQRLAEVLAALVVESWPERQPVEYSYRVTTASWNGVSEHTTIELDLSATHHDEYVVAILDVPEWLLVESPRELNVNHWSGGLRVRRSHDVRMLALDICDKGDGVIAFVAHMSEATRLLGEADDALVLADSGRHGICETFVVHDAIHVHCVDINPADDVVLRLPRGLAVGGTDQHPALVAWEPQEVRLGAGSIPVPEKDGAHCRTFEM